METRENPHLCDCRNVVQVDEHGEAVPTVFIQLFEERLGWPVQPAETDLPAERIPLLRLAALLLKPSLELLEWPRVFVQGRPAASAIQPNPNIRDVEIPSDCRRPESAPPIG